MPKETPPKGATIAIDMQANLYKGPFVSNKTPGTPVLTFGRNYNATPNANNDIAITVEGKDDVGVDMVSVAIPPIVNYGA